MKSDFLARTLRSAEVTAQDDHDVGDARRAPTEAQRRIFEVLGRDAPNSSKDDRHEPPVAGSLKRDCGTYQSAPEQEWIYCNPCLGIPPMVIESPKRFFGIQLLVGIAFLSVYVLLI